QHSVGVRLAGHVHQLAVGVGRPGFGDSGAVDQDSASTGRDRLLRLDQVNGALRCRVLEADQAGGEPMQDERFSLIDHLRWEALELELVYELRQPTAEGGRWLRSRHGMRSWQAQSSAVVSTYTRRSRLRKCWRMRLPHSVCGRLLYSGLFAASGDSS